MWLVGLVLSVPTKDELAKGWTLAYGAYEPGTIHNWTLLASKESAGAYSPVYYAYELNGDHSTLYVSCRGSTELADWVTDMTVFPLSYVGLGDFHGGFLLGGLTTWLDLKKLAAPYPNLYFAGHSLGSATAQVLHALAHKDYPDKKIQSWGFACPVIGAPSVLKGQEPSALAFANGEDIVPKLSIGNVLGSEHCDELKDILARVMETHGVVVRGADKQNVDARVEALVDQCRAGWGGATAAGSDIKYPLGTLFHIDSRAPGKRLADCQIPNDGLGPITLTLDAFLDHYPDGYEKAMDGLVW